MLQGGVGAVLALACLGLGFATVMAWWGGDLRAVLDGASVQFLPAPLCAVIVAGGMAVGGIGGFAASRHAA
jgi:hypothetical protein